MDNNVWLVGDDTECVVIDAPHQLAPILELIGDRRLTAILCTHAHDDHVTAARQLSEATGAPVRLHPADEVLWRQTHPDFDFAAAGRRRADRGRRHRRCEARHTPGHSPGGVCFYGAELGAVFSGDTLFQGGPGATGRSFSNFGTLLDTIRSPAVHPAGRHRGAHRPRRVDLDRRRRHRTWTSGSPAATDATAGPCPKTVARPRPVRADALVLWADDATLLSFPNPVNEKAARVVAAGVVLLSLLALLPGLTWLSLPIAVGFLLRVASGPRFSPLGLLATRLVAPRLGAPKLVPGPPKRFAQAIGAVLSTAAALAHLAFGATGLARVLLAIIVLAALLESVFALCLGCVLFGQLMRVGVISAEVCRACNDVGLRYSQNG